MEQLYLYNMNTKMLKERQLAKNSKQVKRQWIKEGYIFQISIYGALLNKETGEVKGMRIEILAKDIYEIDDLRDIFYFLMQFIPTYTYTIFIFDNNTGDLTLVGKYT